MFLTTLAKCILMSGKPSARGALKDRALVIMGNGPTLRDTIDNNGEWLERNDLLAVNFAANTPDFFKLKPELYVLADPHFFSPHSTDANVEHLWQAFGRVDWPMTLWIPCKRAAMLKKMPKLPMCVTVKFFNMTPGDGSSRGLSLLYDLGLAMPRPRNVLIPSIMVAIREGYSKIYLAGADHTWTKTLLVDDNNRVISIQPHFYKDSGRELNRVATEYAGLHLHDVLGSMTIAFRAYFDIASYAKKKGVEIYNATPGSFIDAFPRLKPE